MPLNNPPLSYTGENQIGSGTSRTKVGITRAATPTEAAAATLTDVYIAPATARAATVKAYGTSSAMTAGAVTVATTSSSNSAVIFYSRKTTGGTPGQVSITAQDGTGFTLTSTSATETSTFNWWILNA